MVTFKQISIRPKKLLVKLEFIVKIGKFLLKFTHIILMIKHFYYKIMVQDIKPANLLISPKRILKIADFGLARIYNELESHKRQYSHQVATRWYRAPELLYGSRTYTPSVDMWSVGCIIGEMINTTPLFPVCNQHINLSESKKSVYVGRN